MAEPIIEFETEKEFIDCCKWWKDKLGLWDWMIKFNLVAPNTKDMTINNTVCAGITDINFINKQAKIDIENNVGVTELTIVHELLHLFPQFIALESMAQTGEQIEELLDRFKDNIIHQSLESMAKAFIMVKYPNIDRSFFDIEMQYWD